MKQVHLSIMILFLIHLAGWTQTNISKEFERIGLGSFEYVPDFDPEASAVILFDKGETRFADLEGWYELHFTRTKRIKIMSEEGLDYADFSIAYYTDGYGKTEKVIDIEAFTYNLIDGIKIEKTSLDPKSVYDETINQYWKKKVFAMPKVKIGSVIEIKYTLVSPFFFNLPDWEFQSSIPTVYSEYIARMIPFYEYVFLLQGISKFDEQTSVVDQGISRHKSTLTYNDYIHTYILKDIPAFKDESYISSRNDYIMKLDFQLAKYHSLNGAKTDVMSTWPELVESYQKHEQFGKYIKKSGKEATSILEEELKISELDSKKKAQTIIEYVKQNFHWNEFYGEHASENPKNLIKTKTGNIGDINLFLIGMLQEAGINARPVLLSTRNHGKVRPDYPFASYFNYVIAYVETDNGSFFADATEPNINFNRIPIRCINDKALMVAEEPIWVDLYSDIESLDKTAFKLELDLENQQIKAEVFETRTEFDAYSKKTQFKDDKQLIEEHLLDQGFSNVSRVETRFYETNSRPYMISYSADFPLEIIDDKILISPLLKSTRSKNPFTTDTRNYPVDLIYKRNEEYMSKIIIPANYKVVSIPESYTLDNSLITIKYDITAKEDEVGLVASVNFKKSVYSSDDYTKLKSYFNIIVKKFNEQIVLEKI